jgi:hypothetical protein
MKSTGLKNNKYYEHREDDKLHCTNGPACAAGPNSWLWCLNDQPHRYYGPYHSDGCWCLHGKRVK